ncbi:MAG TPA: glycosyltransferase [Jiangellaceae bacterium]
MSRTPIDDDDVMLVDVLDVSDVRFEGGTSGSVAEEIRAQAAGGYTTAVLHLDGPLQAKVTPFNPAVVRCLEDGSARLVMPHDRVRARIAVVRHPAVLERADVELPGFAVDKVIVVANAAPRDIDGYVHYRVADVNESARRLFGSVPLWAPIGPLVREALAEELADQHVLAEDWVNIIDVDAWAARRTGWASDRPVIGRHSRDSQQKWPEDAAVLRQVYPTDGSMEVRVLGGATSVKSLIGNLPDAWHVQPFGAADPRDFLAGLDFFVYYHNRKWVEAFGRTILEALASGAVVILPPHFAPVFGDGAIYAEPREVRGVIEALYGDRERYESQAAAGQRIARARFGPGAHVRRLEELIGTTGPEREQRPAQTVTSRRSTDRRRVLMISSNGTGMGHLTRLLAYAQRAPHALNPYFLSLSQAVPLVAQFGYRYEYIPSMTPTGLEPDRWQAYLRARLSEAISRLRPAAVVFDGTWPYKGIRWARGDHPNVPWVWSRRGMWYKGMNRDQLAKSEWFDLVIEPGDLASPADRGVTAEAPATRVRPVTLLDLDDLDERPAARQALGLDHAAPTALVTLGAGNINDASSAIRIAVDALQALGLKICVTKPEIAERFGVHDEHVHVVSTYPLSRHYNAFDVAVSAAGYNSFHELLRFGVPTLFLPNLDTALDDQRTRARYAADRGWAHCLDKPEPHTVRKLLEDLIDNGAAMSAAAQAADPGNGAAAAIEAVAELVEER